MKFIHLISIAIMIPALIYCLFVLYFITYGFIYLIFGRISLKEYKKMTKEFRLSDSFTSETKKFFWFTYTPIYLIVVIFRIAMPFDAEGGNLCTFISIAGYLLILLFSGYTKKQEK